MNNTLKELIFKHLEFEKKLKFKVVSVHKGREFECSISEVNELYESLEEWSTYGELSEFFLKYYITYDYNGQFYLLDGNLILEIEFFGPFEEEFDEFYLSFDEFNLPRSLAKKLLNKVEEIDEELFDFDIEYKNEKFNIFRFKYFDEDYSIVLSDDDLTKNELTDFQNKVKVILEEECYGIGINDLPEDKFEFVQSEESCYSGFGDDRQVFFNASETYKINVDDIES